MGVETQHPDYERTRFAMRTVRDCVAGPHNVKRGDTAYLPMPSAMQFMSEAASLSMGSSNPLLGDKDDFWHYYDPSYHGNPAYAAYKKRAHFPGITSFLLRGLIGIATVRDSSWEIPKELDYLEDNITRDGKDLKSLYKWGLSQGLQVGRYFLLVDVDPATHSFYVSRYKAEALINWKEETIDGHRYPTMIVLEEHPADNSKDEFSHEKIERHRVLRVKNKKYIVEIYEQGVLKKTIVPKYQGKTLSYIPGICVGANDLDLCPDEMPLLSVAEIALQIYMKNADLSQSEFLSCNPTLFLFGVDSDNTPSVVGSNVAIGIENEKARAEYPKTDTTALTHVSQRIMDLMDEAITYGMSLIGGNKKSAETSETTRVRQTAIGATLSSIVDTTGEGIQLTMRIMADWSGASDPLKVEFNPNKAFAKVMMTANEMQSMLQAWLGGAISHDTYLHNMRKAGLLRADIDDDEERRAIEEFPPPVAAIDQADPQGKDGSSRIGGDTGAVGDVVDKIGKENSKDEKDAGRNDD